jgi:hypothetical protein
MNNNIRFSLKKIVTKQFATLKETFGEDIILEIGLKISLNLKDNSVIVSFLVTYKEDELVILIIEVSCSFQIENEDLDLLKNESQIIFPKNFISHLVLITIGTTRGVLHSKTENTHYNKLILPTLSISELVKEDIKFDI